LNEWREDLKRQVEDNLIRRKKAAENEEMFKDASITTIVTESMKDYDIPEEERHKMHLDERNMFIKDIKERIEEKQAIKNRLESEEANMRIKIEEYDKKRQIVQTKIKDRGRHMNIDRDKREHDLGDALSALIKEREAQKAQFYEKNLQQQFLWF
jgi:adenylate kinase family enzyme